MYKLKSNISYIETLNTLDDREDQNYEENERSIKPTGMYLKRLEQKYMVMFLTKLNSFNVILIFLMVCIVTKNIAKRDRRKPRNPCKFIYMSRNLEI